MALFDQTIDETIALTDTPLLTVAFGRSGSDAISIVQSLTIETTFNTDPVTVFDSVLASVTVGVSASDSVALSDVVATGFVRWANPQDTIALTESLVLGASYNRTFADAAVVGDVAHTWMLPDDSELSVDFEGDGDLKAALLKKKPVSMNVVNPPPRVVLLPRPPKVFIEHNVVNPNPPNRDRG